jgi:hypothetical protein
MEIEKAGWSDGARTEESVAEMIGRAPRRRCVHAWMSAAGQNLLKKDHVEFEDFFGSMQSDEIKRSAYVKLTWQF